MNSESTIIKSKTVPADEVGKHLESLLYDLENGIEISITREKRVIAKIIPSSDRQSSNIPDFFQRAKSIFGESLASTLTECLEESRKERF